MFRGFRAVVQWLVLFVVFVALRIAFCEICLYELNLVVFILIYCLHGCCFWLLCWFGVGLGFGFGTCVWGFGLASNCCF